LNCLQRKSWIVRAAGQVRSRIVRAAGQGGFNWQSIVVIAQNSEKEISLAKLMSNDAPLYEIGRPAGKLEIKFEAVITMDEEL